MVSYRHIRKWRENIWKTKTTKSSLKVMAVRQWV